MKWESGTDALIDFQFFTFHNVFIILVCLTSYFEGLKKTTGIFVS